MSPADGSGDVRIPRRVEEAIGRRLLRLSDGCLETLRLGAVIGQEFSGSVLASVSGVPEGRLRGALAEAEAAGVVVGVPDAPGGRRFAHVLIRELLYRALTPHRRAQLHGRVARALERSSMEGNTPGPAELALHFSRASVRHAGKAAEYARRAGDQAMAVLAFEEAARQYELALDVLQRPGARWEKRQVRALSVVLAEARRKAIPTH